MMDTLENGYSTETNEYHHERVSKDGFQKSLHPCALKESSLSVGRVKKMTQLWSLQTGGPYKEGNIYFFHLLKLISIHRWSLLTGVP